MYLLWFAKTLAGCKINNIVAALPPLFCYSFSNSILRNGWPGRRPFHALGQSDERGLP
jgi:hypothetical protein